MKINTALTWLMDFWGFYVLVYFRMIDLISEVSFMIGLALILGLISAGKMVKVKIGDSEVNIEDDNNNEVSK